MRTFSSLQKRKVETESGRPLGRCHDLRGELSGSKLRVTGLCVGGRVHTSLLEAVAAFALILFFAYTFSWVMAFVGLIVKSPEVVNNASFIVIFPLTFIANTFVPLENLPAPLRVFAEWNPVSAVTRAARNLFGNSGGVTSPSHAWPLQHPEVYTLLSGVVVLAIFVPLAVREYKRAAVR